MARKKYDVKAKAEMELNMTSMIDIVFLLIIFFMCVTEMSQLDIRAGIQLPIADQARVNICPERIIINLEWNPGGGRPVMFFRNQRVELPQLKGLLHHAAYLKRETVAPSPASGGVPPSSQAILIRADARVEWQYVQAIMVECAKQKIWKLSLVAKQVQTGGGR